MLITSFFIRKMPPENQQTQLSSVVANSENNDPYGYSDSVTNLDDILGLQSNTNHPDTGNLASNAGVSYTYGDSTHKHAVTGTSNGNSYGYDANGNQITRTVSGQTYTLLYDAENRLVQIKKGSNVQATYTYNGDGNRVKAEVGSTAITYIGNYLEWTGSTASMKRYYNAGGQRVAMREGSSTLYFLLTDHLGSTAVTATSGGGWYSELRYYPWGGTRYEAGTMPTSYRYTGQREAEVGLYFFNARFYDSQLGRFVSPDTEVPESQGTQALDRYAFVNNNPIRWVDPTGHSIDCGIGEANCQAGTIVPLIVSRDTWGAMEPGYHVACGPLGACASTGYNEGYYDPVSNPGGYAEYADLFPGQTLSEVLDTAVIHHEGDFQDYNVQAIQREHMYGNGWMDIGYHYVVAPDGTIYAGRSNTARGSHVEGQNSGSIGILLLGNFEPGMTVGPFDLPFDIYNGDDLGPTNAQVMSTMLLLEWLDAEYGIDLVVGHQYVPGQNTVCPGMYCQPYVERFNSSFGNLAR